MRGDERAGVLRPVSELSVDQRDLGDLEREAKREEKKERLARERAET